MGNELALTNGNGPYTLDEMINLGTVLADSGFFADSKGAAQCVTKILAGREMNIGPIAAMTGIYIVKGRVTLSANLMAAQIKRSGRYSYRVTQLDDTGCEIIFLEQGQEIGRSSFTQADATKAGLWNSSEPWKKTPRNMMFARAMSNGAKWYTPDVFSGPIYTPDELEDATPLPATEKQRNYIGVLMDKLHWTTEQLAAYADEQRVDLVTMTQDQASAFIGDMKTLTEERAIAALQPIRQLTTHAPEAQSELQRTQHDFKALRECERSIGLPIQSFKWRESDGVKPLKDEIAASRQRLITRLPGLIEAAGGLLEGSTDQATADQFNRYRTLDTEMLSHADLIDMAAWLFATVSQGVEVEEAELVDEPAL